MEKKLNSQDALTYMMAGNSIFTVLNVETQNRFTFKVKADKKAKHLFYVSVLRGQNNTKDYTYIGSVINGSFRHTKGSKVDLKATSFQVFNYIFDKLKVDQLPTKVHVFHHGRCGRCGDVLTVPESIERGLGPICSRLIDKQLKTTNTLF